MINLRPHLRRGQLVTMRVPGRAGSAPGIVIDVRTPDNLEPVRELPNVALVAACMRDLGIIEVAYIAHPHDKDMLTFAALLNSAGEWRDLRGQRLLIEGRVEA